ncbi:MAG: Transcriptional regulator [Firmicutes bacterium]|nr:Transcriptional regulator [Bacillota bacterium]
MTVKIDTRSKILKTALKLFQLHGYHATGLNEIIKESGAPKGSIYYYFPNGKEELALKALDLSTKIIKTRIQQELSAFIDPVKAFQFHITEIANFINHPENLDDIPMSLLSLEAAFTMESLRKACAATFEARKKIYVEKLIQSGFKIDKAEELGMIIQLMIEGAITLSLTQKDNLPLLTVVKQIPMLLKS